MPQQQEIGQTTREAKTVHTIPFLIGQSLQGVSGTLESLITDIDQD